jgi:hypothetical protein
LFIDVDEEQNARIETWVVIDTIFWLSSTRAWRFEMGRSRSLDSSFGSPIIVENALK